MADGTEVNLQALRLGNLAGVGRYVLVSTHFVPVGDARAEVRVSATAIGVQERTNAANSGPRFWLYGVQPGDVVADGTDVTEAAEEFVKTLGKIIFDIAKGTDSEEEFEETLSQWCEQICEPLDRDLQDILAQGPEDEIIPTRVREWTLRPVSVPVAVRRASADTRASVSLSVPA